MCPAATLADVVLPGSGDFYVFDDELALFLHYAGNGTNTSFETTDDPADRAALPAGVRRRSGTWRTPAP